MSTHKNVFVLLELLIELETRAELVLPQPYGQGKIVSPVVLMNSMMRIDNLA
jgi:hypothetical protein